MCTGTVVWPQLRRKCSRGALNGLANVVDQTLDQRRVVALGHHPDQRLGARLADDQAPAALELGFGGGDALAHAVGFERLGAAVEADVLEQLRQRLELAQQLARRRFRLDQRGEHLQPGDEPVAGRRMVGRG